MTPLNADFVIDTQVVGSPQVDDAQFNRLVQLVCRMTAKPEFGDAWLAMPAFLELLATGDDEGRVRLLGRLLRLLKESGSRLKVLAPLRMLVRAEWGSENTWLWSPSHLEEVVTTAVANGTIEGSLLVELRDEFLGWKVAQKQRFLEQKKEWRGRFRSDPSFAADIERALEGWSSPQAYRECDDIARNLLEDAGQPESALDQAIQAPAKYLCTWMFALMVRLSQFAASIPGDVRQDRFKLFTQVLTPDRNDLTDANIAASGAQCGILITEDPGLQARVKLLHARNLVRLQAFGVDQLDRVWRPPGRRALARGA